MSDKTIRSKCMAIAQCHFLYTPYKNTSTFDLYKADGIANKGSEICHYCTVDTLNNIIKNGCLRFTDVRFLNDSTEFIEVIDLIKFVLNSNAYTPSFRNFIRNSDEIRELESYTQTYSGYSKTAHDFRKISYHTYTCSFTTNPDSLNMWNYYGASSGGVNIVFDFAWNLFKGSGKTEVTIGERLDNDIILYRGLILYSAEHKIQCVRELLNRLASLFEEAKDDLETYSAPILYAFKEAINHMRCFFKNEMFSCEEEYRAVLKIPEDILLKNSSSDEIFDKGNFKRGNFLIPYIDYKFKRESIKRITVNPFIKEDNTMFKLGIENLLWINNLFDVDITHSNIPIRKYD